MVKMFRFAVITFFVLQFKMAQSQNLNNTVTFIWNEALLNYQISDKVLSQYYTFSGATFKTFGNFLVPVYCTRIKLPSNQDATFELLNTTLNTASQNPYNNKILKSNFEIIQNTSWEGTSKYLIVTLIPLAIQNNQLVKLSSFTWKVNYTNAITSQTIPGNLKAASTSILALGSWYKFSVVNNGVYKLDATFLQSLGLTLTNFNPKNIRIFGRKGGPIAEKISADAPDDLIEMPCMVVGEQDNSFDANDYLLFYGYGPDIIYFDSIKNTYTHTKNIYDANNYYFLTIDNGLGLRIQDAPIIANSTINLSTFNDYIYYDVDGVNLGRTGKTFFNGEDFEYQPSRSYSIATPNVVGNATLLVKTAAACILPSTMNVLVNGVSVQTHSYGSIKQDYELPVAAEAITTSPLTGYNATSLNITLNYVKQQNISGNAWLDYFSLNYKRALIMTNGQFNFREFDGMGVNQIAQFNITASSAITIWNLNTGLNMPLNTNGSIYSFINNHQHITEYVAFDGSSFYTPTVIGKMGTQNLHSFQNVHPNYLVITHPDFFSAAINLANLHKALGQKAAVVRTDEIYNEFGGGKKDPAAIRDFIKLLYNAANGDSSLYPTWVLLMGDGSYDNRNLNNTDAFIPTYQSQSSINPITSYSSDDFYGLLSNGEGENIENGNQLMDVSIGRLPVRTIYQANEMVNKIQTYISSESFGSWRNTLSFVADDEDGNTHLVQSDNFSKIINSKFPEFNQDKIYIDAYKQNESPSGSRYPDVQDAIIRRIENGSIMINYTGHGGETGWAHERIFQVEDIDNLQNNPRYPLFITATCQFSRFDDHTLSTAGERLLMNPKGGAIGLFTTVRLVFSGGNQILNDNIFKYFFNKRNNGLSNYFTGEILQRAKNATGNGDENCRKFTLLGDPGLPLALPKEIVKNVNFNGKPFTNGDTIRAFQKVTITGKITDKQGNLLSNFNGVVYPTLYDKQTTLNTLGNDKGSPVTSFTLQKNAIFKGKASVKNGLFTYTFIAPKDIAYNYGNGKFSYYANDNSTDASGYEKGIIIGGSANTNIVDTKGPELKMYLNDFKFVNGGTTNTSPILLVKLKDENGINTVGNGIGHDISATLDNDPKTTQTLNDFYEGEIDDYQSGNVRFPYNNLSAGSHTIKLKAWDVYNNSSEIELTFIVSEQESISITHVLNYPNPFTTKTKFMFEHNFPGEELDVKITIYTVTGKIAGMIHQKSMSDGYRIDDIVWDGKDQFGDKLARGVYLYKLFVSNKDGKTATKFEKLVIL
jgi:hypothetical protein